MKAYNKKKLEYKDGYLFKGDKVVGISNEIVDLANKLETDVQRAMFEKENAATPIVDNEFSRRSEYLRPHVAANTPTLDAKVEESMKIMEDLDAIDQAECINAYLHDAGALIKFTQQDFVLSCAQEEQHQFDLPMLGNPLDWTDDYLATMIISVFSNE